MMRILMIATGILLAACGVEETPSRGALKIGDRLPSGVALAESERPRAVSSIEDRFGSKATVFYAWSVPCPCVERAEWRIQKLVKKFGPDVRWVGVAGEPTDTIEQIHEKKLRLGSPYPILLDPNHKLCSLLGFSAACQIAVFDGSGRLVYGGALDGDYLEGKGEYVAEALGAVLEGKQAPVPYREQTYGCSFGDPASCIPSSG